MTVNKIQGDFIAPIIKSESTTASDCIQEWVNGNSCSVLCITVDGKATFSHTSNLYDTIIDGNNICLNGAGAQGNFIYGSSSSHLRLPVGNGNQYFNFCPGSLSTNEIARFHSINNTYRTVRIIENGIANVGGPMSRLITWNGSFNTNGDIPTGLNIGIDYNYTNWQDDGTYIYAAGGRNHAGVGNGQDINLLPGKKNPNVSGSGDDGNVVIGDSDRSPKLIINRTGTTSSIYVDSGNSLTFEDSNGGIKRLQELISSSGAVSGVTFGSTQANAGVAKNEIWATSGHSTLPDGVLLIGI